LVCEIPLNPFTGFNAIKAFRGTKWIKQVILLFYLSQTSFLLIAQLLKYA